MKKLILISCLSGLFFSQISLAGNVTGLYKMEVPVTDRQVSTRAKGIVTALRLVLVRLTGDRNAGNSTGVESLFKNAQRYVQQYSYDKPLDQPEQLTLAVQFDQNSLERDIRQLGLPVWGSTRPSALVWLVLDQQGARSFVEAESELGLVLQRHFDRRGIPLVFPRLDAEDMTRVGVQDVLVNGQVLAEASHRYGAEAILGGVLKQSPVGLWEAEWQLQVEQDSQSWLTESDLVEQVIEEGTNGVADSLAARFASASLFGKSGWQLLVENITSVDDYARVQQYLSSLDAVTRVEVKQLDTQTATFYVEAHGGAQAVSQTIALGRTLSPLTPQRFRLMPRVIEH